MRWYFRVMALVIVGMWIVILMGCDESKTDETNIDTGMDAGDDNLSIPTDEAWVHVTVECATCSGDSKVVLSGTIGTTPGMPNYVLNFENPVFPIEKTFEKALALMTEEEVAWEVGDVTFAAYQDVTPGGMGPEAGEPVSEAATFNLVAGQLNEVVLVLTTEVDTDTGTDTGDNLCEDESTCGDNATCSAPSPGEPKRCVCDDEYLGDGEACELLGSWDQHTVGDQNDAIYVFTVDMDSDLDRDLVITSSDHGDGYQSELAWYRNNNNGASFDKFVISPADANPALIATNGVTAADFDQDGAIDVAVAAGPMSNATGGVYLFKGPQDPTSGSWTRVDLFDTTGETFFKIYSADMTGDGYLDIVAGGTNEGLIAINPAGMGDWTVHRMNAETGGGLHVGDLDGDGKPDVVNALAMGNKVTWTKTTWTGTEFTYVDTFVADLDFVLDVNLLDVNGDGHTDILASRIGARGVRWFENPGDGSQNWAEHMIKQNFSGTDIYVRDIDGDGNEDVAISGLAMMESDKLPPSIAWFESYDKAGTLAWHTHWFDYANPGLITPGDIELADINGDDKLDLVTTCVQTGKVYWYENKLP